MRAGDKVGHGSDGVVLLRVSGARTAATPDSSAETSDELATSHSMTSSAWGKRILVLEDDPVIAIDYRFQLEGIARNQSFAAELSLQLFLPSDSSRTVPTLKAGAHVRAPIPPLAPFSCAGS